jgi:hypothetical protein
MPESIIIPLETPVTIPAATEKSFDSLWISQIVIRTLSPTDQSGGGLVVIEYLPMSSETFETLPQVQTISSDKLMQAVAEVPEVAQAMGAILLAVNPLKQWISDQMSPPVPEPEPDPEPEPEPQ